MPADDTQTDKGAAEVQSAQQNQDAAQSDPNAAGAASNAGASSAASSNPVPTDTQGQVTEETFEEKVHAAITEIEEEFRNFWEETEVDAEEIIAWFKEKLTTKKA